MLMSELLYLFMNRFLLIINKNAEMVENTFFNSVFVSFHFFQVDVSFSIKLVNNMYK